MIRAFLLAIGDLADGKILSILLRSLVVTLMIFAGIAILLGWALHGVDPCGWWSADDSCPLDASASGIGALLLTAIAVWLLFPAIAIGVISAYMDRIVAAVEARHYPAALERARPLGVAKGAWLGLRSSLRVILYNLVALPFYVLLLVTGIGTVLLFVAVNGVAIGRDLGEMVAARHGDRATQRAWLATSRGERALMGVIVAAVFLVPIVNLLAPIFGGAIATHLFHGRADEPT
jgi:uncharacterized protein involved in cysteine biosynthesis